MPKDVIITPASGLVDFQGNTGISSATIQLDDNGNLNIANPTGDLTLGDSSADLYVGDGVNNVDVVFEQDGSIRGVTGKTVSLGQTDSYIKVVGGFKDSYGNVGAAGSALISTGAGVSWTNAAGSGAQGLQGTQGIQGKSGSAVFQGDQGIQGLQGRSGSAQGTQGLQGIQGPSGPVGSSFTINNLMVLLYSDETESSGSTNTNSIKSYTVAANTHNYIIVESEVGIDATAADAEWSFTLVYGGVTKETIPLRIANAGTGDQFKLRATLKYAEAFTAGGTVQINVTAVGTAAGTWAVHSFRVYGVDDFLFGAGPQGTQGLQGLQGPQGLQGLQGHQGTQGIQGLQGTQGRQGIQGLQGPQATQGLQGPQATQGLQGPQATQGLQGSQGTQGTQGLQGSQGTQGTQGLQGPQATQGLQGLQGLQGIPGFGIPGNPGDQGVQGLQGTIGIQGVQGLQGINGSQGLQGLQGNNGIQGLQGLQGTFGPPTIPASSSTTTIVASDNGKLVVIAGGITIDDVFNVGENVVIYNNTASQQTITQGTNVTLRLGGTSLTGNRFVQQRGLATVICTTGNEYVISGAGVT